MGWTTKPQLVSRISEPSRVWQAKMWPGVCLQIYHANPCIENPTTAPLTKKRQNVTTFPWSPFHSIRWKGHPHSRAPYKKKQCENLVYFDLFWVYSLHICHIYIYIAHIPKKRICLLYIYIMLYICKYIYIYLVYRELAKGPWNESVNFVFPILNFGGCYWLSEYRYIYI